MGQVPTPQPDLTPFKEFLAGVSRISPVLLGVIPFGVVAGVTATEAGFSFIQTVAMSVIVFAGASQLAALGLYVSGEPIAVIIFTALLINLRMVVYSASLATYLGHLKFRWRALFAYLLTDQGFLVSSQHYENTKPAIQTPYFFFGVSLALWTTWQASTVLGALLGSTLASLPELKFAIPLTFLALLIPALKDKPSIAAALSSGCVAIIGADWPGGLGLGAALIVGLSVGVFLEKTAPEQESP
ncbi:MAG: AzlC family ABC transporter permease [Planctomycetota bacterium]|nr:AzlC family ABC transporter permease [Planctomycetota bacterium]